MAFLIAVPEKEVTSLFTEFSGTACPGNSRQRLNDNPVVD